MKHRFPALVCAALLAVAGVYQPNLSAQSAKPEPCPLRPEFLPELAGVRFGISSSALYEKFQALTPTRNEIGQATCHAFRRETLPRGVAKIQADLLDDACYRFVIEYDDSVKWESAGQFATRIGDAIGAHPEWWALTETACILQCADLAIIAKLDDLGRGVVTVWRPSKMKEIERRKVDAEEKKRREFKP